MKGGPLAAVLTRLEDHWLEPRIHDKLTRWLSDAEMDELLTSHGGHPDLPPGRG